MKVSEIIKILEENNKQVSFEKIKGLLEKSTLPPILLYHEQTFYKRKKTE